MKAAFLTICALAMTCSAQAKEVHSLTCFGNEAFGTPKAHTITLTSMYESIHDVPENTEVLYTLFYDFGATRKVATLFAQSEDVMFTFETKGAGTQVSGVIYMDELDQTSLTIDGVDLNFDCR